MVTSNFDNLARQIDQLSVRERFRLVERIMQTLEQDLSQPQESSPRYSAYGVCADLGPAPSMEDIDSTRRDMLSDFPREDIA